MKRNVKYFIVGFLTASLLAAIPAAAAFVDAYMNTARINIDGVDRVQVGEEIELGENWTTPYSINYNDTLYLPLRKISELSGKTVLWNGDTSTVSVVDMLKDKKVLAEKADADGNIWEYVTYKTVDGASYVAAVDAYRGYTRIYRSASTSVCVTDDCIYFIRLKEHNAVQNQGILTKLSFDCSPETQDGEALMSLYPISDGDVIFDGDYVFFAGRTPGNGTHGRLTAYNYMTNHEVSIDGETWSNISDIRMTYSDSAKDVIEYIYSHDVYNTLMQTTFDKRLRVFSEGTEVSDEE